MDELLDILKQQAQELQMTPSAEVWMKVEADIERREKRRRGLFFLLLFAGLLTAGLACYYVFAERNDKVVGKKLSTIIHQNKSSESVLPVAVKPMFAVLSKQKNKESHPFKKGKEKAKSSINRIVDVSTSTSKINVVSAKNVVLAPAFLSKVTDEEEIITSREPVPGMSFLPMSARIFQLTGQQKSVWQIRNANNIPVPVLAIHNDADVQESTVPKSSTGAIYREFSTVNVIPNTAVKTLTVENTATIKQANNKPDITLPMINNEDTLPPSKKKDRWSMVLNIAPAKSFSSLKEQSDSLFIEKSRNGSSRDLISTDYSLKASYKALPYLEIYAGIGIHNMGERMSAVQTIYNKDTLGITSGNVFKKNKEILLGNDSGSYLKNKYTYLEVPLGVQLSLVQHNKLNISLDAGIGINRLIQASGNYYDSSLYTYRKMDKNRLKPWLFSYSAGLNIQYALSEQVALGLMPYYKYLPGSVIKEDRKLSQYIQQAGLSISVRYNFKKVHRK